jgi:hypothetical protein
VTDNDKPQGVGARPMGLGDCQPFAPGWCSPELSCAVQEYLTIGSPRIAWAISQGVPTVPFKLNVIADFPDTTTDLVPDQGQQDKIVQDWVIRNVRYQVQNQRTPGGVDSITNYYFEQESGIEAKLKTIGGGGGYNPVPEFTPIRQVAGPLGKPWLVTYTNAFKMDFIATVPLPFRVKVTVTFEGETIYWPRLIDMTSLEAIRKLKDAGFAVAYCMGCYQ